MKEVLKTSLKVIDSHTGGEPTRVVVDGAPDLGAGSVAERLAVLKAEHDWVRTSVLLEPRGFEAMVGALLVEPSEAGCVAGVIFFNNVGYLNMCIHGTIGLAMTLKHMGVIDAGSHRIDTCVGVVTVHMNEDGSVSVDNVPSYLAQEDVEIEVPVYGTITGDVAWGGNWFFLVDGQGPEVCYQNVQQLADFTHRVSETLAMQGIVGEDGGEIDHIEVFGAPANDEADSRNFVMCPGGEYDRSPCGTGTSAKLAVLYGKGKLKEGETWRQASILNTVFTGKVKVIEGRKVIPTVTGRAWVNGESSVFFDPSDPFAHGIFSEGIF